MSESRKLILAPIVEQTLRDAGITKGELAERLGLRRETISRLVRGHHVPSLPTALAICAVLRDFEPDLSIEDILTVEGEIPTFPGETSMSRKRCAMDQSASATICETAA